MPARPGRTGRGGTPSPLLMKLLGGRSGTDLSGVDFVDSNQPGALSADGKVQTINRTQKAVPQHFWDAGKAENINNQLTVGRITGDEAANRQLQTAKALVPINLDELEKRGAITNAQRVQLEQQLNLVLVDRYRQIGNNSVLGSKGFIANPENEKAYNESTFVPNLNKEISGMNTATDMNEAHSLDLTRGNKIKANTFDPTLGGAINEANKSQAESALGLKAVPANFELGQKTKQAQLDLIKSEALKGGVVNQTPGSNLLDLKTGSVTAGPAPLPIQTINDLKIMQAEKDAATGNVQTSSATGAPTTFNATPLPAPLKTQQLPSMPSMQNGKYGRMVPDANGNMIWTEYAGQ